MPYIEKQNGNIYARKHSFEKAITHYEKALYAMKSLFDGMEAAEGDDSHGSKSLVNDRESALRLILDIEIPVCVNLALCYLKLGKFHHAINYSS